MSRYHVPPAGTVGTELALIRLLAGVSSLVGRQVVAATKHLFAFTTLIRLEAGVEARVSCKHVGARERAATLVAKVTLGALVLLAS